MKELNEMCFGGVWGRKHTIGERRGTGWVWDRCWGRIRPLALCWGAEGLLMGGGCQIRPLALTWGAEGGVLWWGGAGGGEKGVWGGPGDGGAGRSSAVIWRGGRWDGVWVGVSGPHKPSALVWRAEGLLVGLGG